MKEKLLTYSREQLIKESTKYFEGDDLAAEVFPKYALRDKKLKYLEKTPLDMHKRLSVEFARIESKYPNPLSEEEIFQLIDHFKYIIPQGSPMFGIGNIHQKVSLSNCFVIEVVDSYGGICRADERIAQISKRRGGVGLDISAIRPQGVSTRNSAFTTDGIGIFMERFSNTSREVAQNGRRGALMITISVHHPEILTFINIKRNLEKVTGANTSIRVSDEFMEAVKKNKTYEQRWPINSENPKVKKRVKAKEVWNEIIKSVYLSGEPGILFWDNIIKNSPADSYKDLGFETKSTNPCLTGDTLVYVADGRGNVSIEQLADEDKDVSVFCYDNNNQLTTSTMRNPRITGYHQPIYKVTLDDGSIIRTTANHKFLTTDEEYKRVDKLEKGDSLKILTRYEAPLSLSLKSESGSRVKKLYYWISDRFCGTRAEHRYIAEYKVGENLNIVSIEFDGYEKVYNGTVDDFHNFFVGGFDGKTKSGNRKYIYLNSKNCGELPLCPYDSCRLMCINLTSYVDDPFTEKASFNKSLFKQHIWNAQKLMDDLVDLELEAIDKIIRKIKGDPEDAATKANELDLWKSIKKKCKDGRRTGLGLTGLADCLAMQNVKYGSEKSLKIVGDIYSMLRDEAYRCSIALAQERGVFPIYNHKMEWGNNYLNRLPESIKKEMRKYGRRNIGCLTTAPAGSVSVEAQVSNGIEPVFKVQYKRKRKLNDNDHEKPDFVDNMGDKWKEYVVSHHGLKKFQEITGKSMEESPYFGAQAEEIDYLMRVKIQAAATQYVDHAISSTINLPVDIPIEKVSNLFMMAWESGCKGLTIYRSGSRDGVLVGMDSTRECEDCDEAAKAFSDLVREGKRPTNIIMASAPKRPPVMECDIHRSKVGGGDWLFFVGKLNGRPYEVFGGDGEQFTVPNKYRTGWILKNGKIDGVSQYNIVLGSLEDKNEKLEFKGITKHFNNYEYGAFTRVISLTMRHGVPINYICEQITKKEVEGDLFSFQRAMSRVLKKYIAEGERSESECPECHSKEMIYKNGCPSCQVCGHSNCA